ncbi:Fe-S cluster assembly protein SufD [Taibaiella soli]|uniref:Fe-S cluster assembly protein SufD n=1 Tax=Taibaiella soli TaxID=1649169 RepID=A0A2W2AE39_9BACT|nr:Fe-S cluster assembly protein SufD [Taibaiella soli]PZF71822.1 Fe-S cluster assembly protein SufD [Taibaiella soli]
MTDTVSLYDQFQALHAERNSGREGWLKDIREAAFNTFTELGFPTIKREDWKYTNVLPFLKEEFQVEQLHSVAFPATISDESIAGLDAHIIVLQNGRLTNAPKIKGVKIATINDAVDLGGAEEYLAKSIPVEKHPFAALNTALFEDGIVIEIEKNVQVDKPLHIIHTYNSLEAAFVQPRILVISHKHSHADIIETTKVLSNYTLFSNSVTEVYVKENAQLNHYVLQSEPATSRFVSFRQATQEKDSLYNNYTFTMPGAALVRNNLIAALKGTNVETHMFGLYLASDNQLIDNHTSVEHQQPNCFSNELYKGVLKDTSKAIFSGRIHVFQDAQKTNAFQQNNNLLLSDKATVDSKPQLEIYADDVKCSHGSTAGSFNKESLFYLQSRGIGEATARNMLVAAFAFDVTSKVKIPALRAHIEHLIEHNLTENYD